jgi:hypothetical protein
MACVAKARRALVLVTRQGWRLLMPCSCESGRLEV